MAFTIPAFVLPPSAFHFSPSWPWLTTTDAGLLTRIAIGGSIFLLLAIVDLWRNGSKARRWREYCFLLFTTAAALVYGAVNDSITVRISPEYFLYGKELAPVVAEHPQRLPCEAVKVGLKATWTVGLLVGVAFLLANNPSRRLPQLSYRQLALRLSMVLGCVTMCAVILGVLGHAGHLAFLSDDFRQMLRENLLRPRRFMTTYGIHLGGYLGGVLGTTAAIVSIRRGRKAEGGRWNAEGETRE